MHTYVCSSGECSGLPEVRRQFQLEILLLVHIQFSIRDVHYNLMGESHFGSDRPTGRKTFQTTIVRV
jgi:hypothetical protein